MMTAVLDAVSYFFKIDNSDTIDGAVKYMENSLPNATLPCQMNTLTKHKEQIMDTLRMP